MYRPNDENCKEAVTNLRPRGGLWQLLFFRLRMFGVVFALAPQRRTDSTRFGTRLREGVP